MTAPIQGLWVGPELSAMERLSIQSFLFHGHAYHLYVYDDVGNIPAGAVVKDAAGILPHSRIFRYREGGSYAGFANFFRYKLLLDRGGWWVDTDVVCLQRFSSAGDYVFSSETAGQQRVVNCGVIKAPAGSAIMAEAWRCCQNKDPERLRWGETGPGLLQDLVRQFSLQHNVQPAAAFCPLAWGSWPLLQDKNFIWTKRPETLAIHLWNEMWRRAGCDKNRHYHPDCLYERLRRDYGH